MLPSRPLAALLAVLALLGGAYLAGRTHGKAHVQARQRQPREPPGKF